jgi:myxalamid-type polyketide synthase MxaB
VSERRTLLVAYIRTAVASVLGFHAVAPIDTRQALSTLGIDSLMAVDLKNRLEFSIGCALRPTLVFDYPTVEAIADYLLHQVLYVEDTQEARPQWHDGETRFSGVQATQLEELPEAEAEAMLLDELDKLNY